MILSIDEFTSTYTANPQGFNNWLIHNDISGQLVGWICKTKQGSFEACRLRFDDTNGLEVATDIEILEEAKLFVFNASSVGGKS